jgi:hypothetical protein
MCELAVRATRKSHGSVNASSQSETIRQIWVGSMTFWKHVVPVS